MDSTHTPGQYIQITDSTGKETEIPFRHLIESVNEGIYCVNTNGEVVYANERFCKNLGYTVNEVLGQDIFSLLYNAENVALAKAKMELRKKGVSDSYDIQVKTKSGTPLWVRMNGKPLNDASGAFIGAIVVSTVINQQRELEQQLRDVKEDLEWKVITRTRQLSETNQKLSEQIKERRLAEISLKNSEKRFRDIYLSSPDAIYIESLDGVILDVNDATCRLHHTTKENLVGKSIYDISPAHAFDEIKQRQPKIASGEITIFESECLTTDGTVLPIEVSVAQIEYQEQKALLMHVRDISDRKNNERLLQSLNSDLEEKVNERTRELQEMNEKLQREINEKAQIELELQRQKDFLRLIIDSTPNLIFVKDQSGKFLLANKATATFYGMETNQMEGHFDTEQNFNAEELVEFKEQDQEVLKAGQEVKFPEQCFVNPD
ncbi:MAG: PAS domain S-box protein, partial [Chitinophagales bacterium]|nr:PAS domain S-box protein [Chitinophagales bacterium]